MTAQDDYAIAASVLLAWFDASRVGRICVSQAMKVVRANRAAANLLREGVGLHVHDGYLTVTSQEVRAALLSAMRRKRTSYAATPPCAAGNPTMVLIEPLAEIGLIISLWRAGRAPVRLVAPLADFFSLSQQQARVAAELVAGRSVEGIARKLGVTIATVRSHLKALYEKTGARSQAEVVARAMRYVPS